MMLRQMMLVVPTWLTLVSVSLAEVPPEVSVANSRLSAYHDADRVPTTQTFKFVYFTPADRDPPPGYRERLGRQMLDIQRFYADEMERYGLGRRTIRFDTKPDGAFDIIDVKGKRPCDDYLFHKGGDSRSLNWIKDESKPALKSACIDPDKVIVIYFCNLRTIEGSKITGVGPFNGSGSFTGKYTPGRCWFIDSAWADPKLLSDKTTMIDDEQYKHISLGKYNSIFIGGAAHEVGHALGLPHDTEQPQFLPRRSMMNTGNRTYRSDLRGENDSAYITLPDALRLASHPMLSGSDRGISEKVTCQVVDVKAKSTTDGLEFTGRIEASVPAYAVVVYSDTFKPNKSGKMAYSDYDSYSWTGPIDGDNRFTVRVGALKPGQAQLRLLVCHVNAASSQFTYGFTVDKDGKSDVSKIGAPSN